MLEGVLTLESIRGIYAGGVLILESLSDGYTGMGVLTLESLRDGYAGREGFILESLRDGYAGDGVNSGIIKRWICSKGCVNSGTTK